MSPEKQKQGQILAKFENAHIYKYPEEGMPVYNVLQMDKSSSYGSLKPLLMDDQIEEIMYNDPKKCVIVAHRQFGMCRSNVFINEDEALEIIQRIGSYVGRKVGMDNLLLDARLPDGSRVNATLPPSSPDGPTMTIRKFLRNPLTIINLIKFQSMTTHVAAMLWLFVEGLGAAPSNILVAGGTGSGKTTTLNTLGIFIPASDRLITIEDVAEVQLRHEHWVRLETVQPTTASSTELDMDTLLKNTLRMRPDRLIVGEVRGPEAATLFMAMNTGHDGCMGTCHANTAQETVTRLTNPPMNVPPIMMNALDLIIMQTRVNIKGKNFRKITEISELAGLEKGKPRLNTLFRFDKSQGNLIDTGVPSKLREKISAAAGISPKQFDQERKARKGLLDEMVAQDVTHIEQVSKVVQNYYLRTKGG